MRSSTLDSLHTGVSPGSIGCAYTYSGPFREAQISEQPLQGFPQVILFLSQSRAEHTQTARPDNADVLSLRYYYYLKCLLGLKDILQYFFRLHTGGALIYIVRYCKHDGHLSPIKFEHIKHSNFFENR